jgi:hypothetical protein
MPHTPRTQPILQEVRSNRGHLLRASGGTLDSLYELLKRREGDESRPVVKLPARRYTDDGSDRHA